MITENYVSFDTAKLLEEKGFDEYCPLWYHLNKPTEGPFFYKEIGWYGHNSYCYAGRNIISAPSFQMTMKWLREVHKIHIVIGYTFRADANLTEDYASYCFEVENAKTFLKHSQDEWYVTYEEACDAAIKYCLENLI